MEWMGIITMRINNFGYLLREGFRGIFIHGFMTLASIFVTIACLVIVGSFSVLLYNLNIMVERVERDTEIIVYVDEAYSDAAALSVGSKLNLVDNVYQTKFVTREEALADFIAQEEDSNTFQGVEADVLQDRFIVTLVNNDLMKETAQLLMEVPGVADVSAPFEMAEALTTVQHVMRVISAAIIILLLVVSLLIISNTVKLAMYARRDEIAIMKMVGATNGFIRLPFFVEGLILGLTGACLAFFLEWALYNGMVQWIDSVSALSILTFVPFTDLLIPMIVTFGAAGLFVGIFGSLTSIRRFLDV